MSDLQTNNIRGFRVLSKVVLLFIVAAFITFTSNTNAQEKGSISGKITDGSNNDVLIGANVLVTGTSIGASSDLDGYYSIKNLLPGTYQLKFSFISYQTIFVDNIKVEAGKETKINVTMQTTSTELSEVVVTAEALKNSEGALLNIQKNSLNIVDGMSAELISKNNSSDGTDILKRMTGITIADGKFAYVRGVGDRYNNTLLNGSSLPSTDPEKRSFSYDIFPASLIENILTSKTFTPDKPADFSGGLVEINTIEFPSKFILDISASTSYNTVSNLKDFVTYSGGKSDWLGMDDGTRDLPSLISDQKVGRGNYTSDELQAIGQSFNNNWDTKNSKTPLNGSFKINIGDKFELGEQSLFGYIASLTYSNSDDIKEVERNNYTFEGPRYEYNGFNYTNSVSLGALLNMSFKLDKNNKISFKNIYNQNADDETAVYQGAYYSGPDYRDVTALRYVERSLYSTQFIGEHNFTLLSGIKMDWNLNYGTSTRNEPDARRYVYSRPYEDPTSDFRFLLDQSLSTRFYGKLKDNSYGGSINFNVKPFEMSDMPNFKFGFNIDKKDRTFDARTFGFRNIPGGNFMQEDSTLLKPVDQIFTQQNINSKFIEVVEITKPSDSYDSNQEIIASYLMTDFTLFSDLKVITGARYEHSKQEMSSYSLTDEIITVAPTYKDWLPSLNLTYAFNEKINIRAAASRTLARPEFRELAPFSYFDFVTNELVQGNSSLKRSLINNYDLRFEIYPNAGELFAVSVFYKKFDAPIEQILLASSSFEPIRSYQNAKSAENYGVEFELRKNLGFFTEFMKDFSFVGNMSLIKSKIQIDGNGFQESERALQGQANYIVNIGLYYDNYIDGITANITYNKVGERIARVGFAGIGNIVELPRDQIDLSFSKKLFDSFSIKVNVKDLLAQDSKFIQRTVDGDKTSELGRKGRVFTVGFSYQF
ncbi:MAG: TonB-dependent receptor [Melioribacteraceae bacterium]|nr:TonB-dependent receptor [Melioribacteraceae bacterium]